VVSERISGQAGGPGVGGLRGWIWRWADGANGVGVRLARGRYSKGVQVEGNGLEGVLEALEGI
jgi:hypothetical protein